MAIEDSACVAQRVARHLGRAAVPVQEWTITSIVSSPTTVFAADDAILVQDGLTPLYIACKKEHPECIKALLAGGAGVSASTETVSDGGVFVFLIFVMLRSMQGKPGTLLSA